MAERNTERDQNRENGEGDHQRDTVKAARKRYPFSKKEQKKMSEAGAPTSKIPCREATAVRKIRDPKDDRRWRHNARRRFPAFPFRSRCLPVSSFMLRPYHLNGRKDSFHRKKPVIDDGCNGGDWAMNPFCPLSPMSEDASKFVIGNDVTVIPE